MSRTTDALTDYQQALHDLMAARVALDRARDDADAAEQRHIEAGNLVNAARAKRDEALIRLQECLGYEPKREGT